MNRLLALSLWPLLVSIGFAMPSEARIVDARDVNPRINMAAFLDIAKKAADHRESRLVTEEEFIEMSTDPETIIIDARSQELYDKLHIKGAINLNFSDISFSKLAKVLPDKNKRILIYCNNNFMNDEDSFPSKSDEAALNLSTYISLYTYGYMNVYELLPLLDVKQTKIPLISTARR